MGLYQESSFSPISAYIINAKGLKPFQGLKHFKSKPFKVFQRKRGRFIPKRVIIKIQGSKMLSPMSLRMPGGQK